VAALPRIMAAVQAQGFSHEPAHELETSEATAASGSKSKRARPSLVDRKVCLGGDVAFVLPRSSQRAKTPHHICPRD
jgi:hypothetical protein